MKLSVLVSQVSELWESYMRITEGHEHHSKCHWCFLLSLSEQVQSSLMRSTLWSQLRHELVDLVRTAVFKEEANVMIWLVIHVMFIEHEHRFLEHEYRFIESHVVLSLMRTLKNSCLNLSHVTCTAEFSLMHSHTLLPSLCLILYVSNTKYSMMFQSISVLLYLDSHMHSAQSQMCWSVLKVSELYLCKAIFWAHCCWREANPSFHQNSLFKKSLESIAESCQAKDLISCWRAHWWCW